MAKMDVKVRKVFWAKRTKWAWACIYYDRYGTRKQEVVGQNKKAADDQAVEIRDSLRRKGTHVGRRESATFGEVLDLYLEGIHQRHARCKRFGFHSVSKKERMSGYTIKSRINAAEKYARPKLGPILVANIDRKLCQELIDEVAGKFKAVHHHVAKVVKQTLDLAVENEWLAISPLTKRPLVVGAAGKKLVIPAPDDIRLLMQAASIRRPKEREISVEYRMAMITLGAVAGLRVGEIAALQFENLDFSGSGWIHIRNSHSAEDRLKDPKNEPSIRDVPMFPMARAMLEPIVARAEADGRLSGYVFTTTSGRPVGNQEVYRSYFATAMRHAGLMIPNEVGGFKPKFDFHSLRHVAASLMLESGMSLVETARVIGHSNTMTIQKVYAHVLKGNERARETLEQIGQSLYPTALRDMREINGQASEIVEA